MSEWPRERRGTPSEASGPDQTDRGDGREEQAETRIEQDRLERVKIRSSDEKKTAKRIEG